MKVSFIKPAEDEEPDVWLFVMEWAVIVIVLLVP